MGHHKTSSKRMLDRDLCSTDTIVIRLCQGKRRVLKTDNTPENRSATVVSQKKKEKKEASAVRKLDKEMEVKTDPALLYAARVYQEGVPIRPFPSRPEGH
jgi:hypothetical protein